MMMQHRFTPQGSGVRELRRAGIGRAWAIVRPYPGKDGLLCALLDELGWEYRRPVFARYRRMPKSDRTVRYETPALPGYLFIRPPSGQRRQLQYLPHVADVRKIVIFDRLLMQVEVEVARKSAEIAGDHSNVDKSKKPKRGRFAQVLVATREKTAFEQLAALLAIEVKAAGIDTMPRNGASSPIQQTALDCASLDEYYSTDAAQQGERQCEAMVRRRNYFQ